MFGWSRKPNKAARSRRRRLEFETLEGRVTPSTTVLESEPNDAKESADFFSFPTTDGTAVLRGLVANSRDKDFFAFTVRASTTLSVDVGTTNGVIAKLDIEDNLGNKVFETQPNNGINAGSTTVVPGRTYFVRLKIQDAIPAAYDVIMTLTNRNAAGGGAIGPTRTRETEPNNVRSSADLFRFSSSGAAQLLGTSLNRDERDFFVFTPTQSGRLNFQVAAAMTNGVVAQLEIQNAQGVTLFETDPNSGINSGIISVTARAQYFIRLRAPSTRAASYEANLTLI